MKTVELLIIGPEEEAGIVSKILSGLGWLVGDAATREDLPVAPPVRQPKKRGWRRAQVAEFVASCPATGVTMNEIAIGIGLKDDERGLNITRRVVWNLRRDGVVAMTQSGVVFPCVAVKPR